MAQFPSTPNGERAQEIVAEARQRLAASGGKASMLPAMIQRVTQEYDGREGQTLTRLNNPDYRQPNDMEAYIDKVLGMSGLNGAPNAGGSSGASGGADVPVPTERPTPTDDEVAGTPVNDADTADAADSDTGLSSIAKGLLAAGLGAAGVYAFMRQFGQKGSDAADAAINGTGKAVATVDPNMSNVDKSIAAVDGEEAAPKQARIEGPNRPQLEGPTTQDQLAAPQQKIAGPQSPTDDMIDQTMSQDDIDKVFQDRVEGRGGSQAAPGPNRFSGDSPVSPEVEQTVKQVSDMLRGGDIRGAKALLSQHGIDVDDNLLREFAASSNAAKTGARSLSDRVGSVAGDAAAGAVRRAVRP